MTEKTAIAVTKPKRTSKRGVERYEENPFLPQVTQQTKVRRIADKNGEKLWVMSSETGQVHTQAGFWYAQEVDKTQFVKLYINGVKAFKELSGAGTKVFEVLYATIQNNMGKDRVYISYAEINQAVTPMSEATFYRGMSELVNKEFIAESVSQCWYYVNPDYVWNGDRLAFVKEFRLKQSTKEKDTKTLDLFEAK